MERWRRRRALPGPLGGRPPTGQGRAHLGGLRAAAACIGSRSSRHALAADEQQLHGRVASRCAAWRRRLQLRQRGDVQRWVDEKLEGGPRAVHLRGRPRLRRRLRGRCLRGARRHPRRALERQHPGAEHRRRGQPRAPLRRHLGSEPFVLAPGRGGPGPGGGLRLRRGPRGDAGGLQHAPEIPRRGQADLQCLPLVVAETRRGPLRPHLAPALAPVPGPGPGHAGLPPGSPQPRGLRWAEASSRDGARRLGGSPAADPPAHVVAQRRDQGASPVNTPEQVDPDREDRRAAQQITPEPEEGPSQG
mmetsp:Transcript_16056/g.55880  ORF Transcript_16056/g.55880 Transcript_16056/m.55880 type:complete len:304 (+) Transcript_16056:690-1601(+)